MRVDDVRSNMEDSSVFEEKGYWVERHERLRGDVRSVGNLGKSVEQNAEGQALLRERLKIVLTHLIPSPAGKSVLDLGCGIGLLSPVFTGYGLTYLGVDVSPAAVEQARQVNPSPRADFVVGDLVTHQEPRRFDVVVASYVLVHLVEDDDWIATLKNIAGWLHDDGYFVLIDDVPEARRDEPRHVVTRTLQQYREALPQCGLRLMESWLETERAALGGDLTNFVVVKPS